VVALLSLPAVKIVMSDYLAEEQAEREVRESWWDLQNAFNGALRATIDDTTIDDAQKLSDITASLEEYRGAVLLWAKEAISRSADGDAAGGAQPSGMMGAPDPSETKEGRVLSADSKKKIQAAIEALNALLAAAEKSATAPGAQAQDADPWSLSAKDEAPAELVAQLAQLQRGTN
jgi:hypothetical protein